MQLSLVTTVYRSEQFIREFHRRVSVTAKRLVGDDFEVIYVNDGSPDASLATILELESAGDTIKVVDLSRNFGHHRAMLTGLEHARGERILLIDCDLEEDPELLATFWNRLEAEQVDVVYGVQALRKGGFLERLTGTIFYRLLNVITDLELTENIVVARLMTKRYVDALLSHPETELFLAGLWAITGYEQRSEVIHKGSRNESTYTLRKKLAQFVDSVTSFSSMPLIITFFAGFAVFSIALLFGLYVAFQWVVFERPPDGWASLIISVWLLGGLIILFIGVVGIYVSRIFAEVKRRPRTIVRDVHVLNDNGEQP